MIGLKNIILVNEYVNLAQQKGVYIYIKSLQRVYTNNTEIEDNQIDICQEVPEEYEEDTQ